MESTELAVYEPHLLTASRQFHRVSTYKELRWSEEKHFMMDVLTRTPSLRACTPESLVQSVLQAAGMGLSLNPIKKQVYLIPRKERKKRQGESDADYGNVPTLAYASPSYMGLCDLATREAVVRWMKAEVVFIADHFLFRGPLDKPDHAPTVKADQRREMDAIGVYCVAKTVDGDYLVEFMDRHMVQLCRKMSDIPNSTMWHPDKLWTEGWKKAVIRRAWKTLPKSPAALNAFNQLNTYEGYSLEPMGERLINPPSEPLPTITPDEYNQLHAMCTDNGFPADEWLRRLAMRFGFNAITELPQERFEAARAMLQLGITQRRIKK